MSNQTPFPFSWKPIVGAVDAIIRDFRGDRDVRDWKPATTKDQYKFLGYVMFQVSVAHATIWSPIVYVIS